MAAPASKIRGNSIVNQPMKASDVPQYTFQMIGSDLLN